MPSSSSLMPLIETGLQSPRKSLKWVKLTILYLECCTCRCGWGPCNCTWGLCGWFSSVLSPPSPPPPHAHTLSGTQSLAEFVSRWAGCVCSDTRPREQDRLPWCYFGGRIENLLWTTWNYNRKGVLLADAILNVLGAPRWKLPKVDVGVYTWKDHIHAPRNLSL